MSVFNLIAFLGCLVFAGLGGGAVWYWDHHGPVGFVVAAPLRWVLPEGLKHPALPPSLAMRAEAAEKAENLAQDGLKACRASLGSQSAAVALLGRKSAAAQAQAAHDIAAARAVAESLRRASADLDGYRPQGQDQCARLEDADRAVREALR